MVIESDFGINQLNRITKMAEKNEMIKYYIDKTNIVKVAS